MGMVVFKFCVKFPWTVIKHHYDMIFRIVRGLKAYLRHLGQDVVIDHRTLSDLMFKTA